MTTGSLLVLALVFLGTGVYEHDGLFSLFALAWLTLGFGSLLTAALGYLGKIRVRIAPPSEHIMLGSLLFFVYIATLRLPGAFVAAGSAYANTYHLSYIAFISLICFLFFFRQARSQSKVLLLFAGTLLALILRMWMLSEVPNPAIDVFSAAQRAAETFLGGASPYIADMSGNVTFHYPPLNAYLQSISYALSGDVRWLNIFSEALFALFLFLAAIRSMGSVRSLLLVSLFLFHPRGIYIIGLAWTEPPILALLAASLFFASKDKKDIAAGLYGLMLSMKQFLVFFVIHWFLLNSSRRHTAILVGAAILTTVPFLIIDPAGMWENGFMKTLQGEVRNDSLTFVTFLKHIANITLPRMTGAIVGLAVSTWSYMAFRRYPEIPGFLFSVSLTTFALFLFGGQAFANYYYFVSGLVLLLIAYHPKEESNQEADC